MYSKESLSQLKNRIDLVDLLSQHLNVKRMGSSYKALCPFHAEKSPSFVLQKGDSHYHCFGCGAHGDAIQFLMSYLGMTFTEAVESLAERYQVVLEKVDKVDPLSGEKTKIKEALSLAADLFHQFLLYTQEGHAAIRYLYSRGLDLPFLIRHKVGYVPKDNSAFMPQLLKKFGEKLLIEAGILSSSGKVYFSERIAFPIFNPQGTIVGFSARKFIESTFGGKYINSPETPLFKKSETLFGLNLSRKRIAKERRAIVVEGQIDALRLIDAGLDLVVAGQGTAFGEAHVGKLKDLGVSAVFLALDGDEAGQTAALKIGNLFQMEAIEVFVVKMQEKEDPDSILSQQGINEFVERLQNAPDWLSFAVEYYRKRMDLNSPAGKSELIELLGGEIRKWQGSIMVHESLRKLAHLVQVPEEMVLGSISLQKPVMRKSMSAGSFQLNAEVSLEGDILRWLLVLGKSYPHYLKIAASNLKEEDFKSPLCRTLFTELIQGKGLVELAMEWDGEKQAFLEELLKKKIAVEKSEGLFKASILKILERNWKDACDACTEKLKDPSLSDDDTLALTKRLSELHKNAFSLKEMV